MKKVLSFIICGLLLWSCGNKENVAVADVVASQDLGAIRAKRGQLTQELKTLEDQISQLDKAIGQLDANASLPLVTTMAVAEQSFHHYLELQGDVMTDQNVLVYPEMAGTLYKVYVKEGQKVSKGQLLAAIDDGGLSSQLAQLKTQLALAKTTFERQKRLWDQNIGSEIQFLQAKSQYEAQESAVKQMESTLGKATINAPFAGIVDQVIKDQGTVVAPGPGSEVFRIVNLSNMYVEVEVPEAHLGKVSVGKEAEIFFPVLGSTVQTKVSQTGNFIHPGNRSFKVELPVSNKSGNIKPNLTAIAKINDYANEKAILIPQSVVSENATGAQYVYLAQKEASSAELVSKKTIITLGKTQGDIVEVLTGLKAGDQIIVEGARSVRDGQKIKTSK